MSSYRNSCKTNEMLNTLIKAPVYITTNTEVGARLNILPFRLLLFLHNSVFMHNFSHLKFKVIPKFDIMWNLTVRVHVSCALRARRCCVNVFYVL